MPYLGGGGPGGSGSPYVRPPAPPPPPRAPVPRAPGQSHAVYTPPPAPVRNPHAVNPTAPPTHTDITSSGPGYGSAQANRYKASPAYKSAVLSVFKAQPPAQQKAIVSGALRNPTAEGALILNYIKTISSGPGGGRLTAGLIGAPQLGSVYRAAAGVPQGFFKVLKNAGTDIANLPSGTVQGLYGLGKESVQAAAALGTGNVSGAVQHEGNAFHMLIDPYVRLAEHPVKTVEQHPVNSLLMLLGPKAAIGKGVGAAMRAGTFGDTAAAAASTARPDLSLGTIGGEPSPVVEARSYSNDIINKGFQVARKKRLEARGLNPNIARPAPRLMPQSMQQAFNVGQTAKLNRIADEMTAVRQAAGRQDRARMLNALHQSAPPKAARNVVAHVLQGVLRTPESAAADAGYEINRLKAAQTGRRTVGEIWNRQQVRALQTALKTPGAFDQAFKSAAEIRPLLHAQDSYLVSKGLLDEAQALRSRLFPYAQAHMGATYDHALGELVAPGHGQTRSLPTDEILKHLEDNGVPDPAYVGHLPGKVSPGRFYSAYRLARGSLANAKRTGEAFKSGAYDHSWEGLAAQIASRTEAVTKASLHDKVINRLGVVPSKALLDRLGIKSDNGLLTPREAERVARAALVDDNGNPIPNATELRPISTAPANALSEVRNLQQPLELNNLSGIEIKALSHAIDDAANRTDQTRNVALIPKVLTDRFAQQFAKTDATMRGVGHITQQFRRTVLPYSTHWMLQIGSEAGIRSILGGVLPHHLADGRRLMARLETTDAGRAALQEMVNATFYNKRDPLAVHNPNVNPLVAGARAFPPTRLIMNAHNRYADTIGHAMYTLEHNARLAGLGKLAHKEVAEFSNSWKNAVRLQGSSIEELARRLETNPALVAKLGRQIDDTFGKYNKFSPKVRGAIQSIAPFLPWYLNAAKYVLWHLPAHHPVSSALLASLRQTVAQDVADGKQLPLNTFAMQELARISPFGIFTPDSPSAGDALKEAMSTGASVVLPQLMGPMYNFAGVNSFGDQPLKGPGGDVKGGSGPARAAALESLFEAFMPLASKLREVREGGKPSFGTSTLVSPQPKPGAPPSTPGSVLSRLFNPFYSFERAQKAGGGRGLSGGWGGGSSATTSSGGWGGGSSGATSSGGWGGGSSAGSSSGSGGWGP